MEGESVEVVETPSHETSKSSDEEKINGRDSGGVEESKKESINSGKASEEQNKGVNEEPTTNNEGPTTNNEGPTTNNEGPTTNNEGPPENKQKLPENKKKSQEKHLEEQNVIESLRLSGEATQQSFTNTDHHVGMTEPRTSIVDSSLLPETAAELSKLNMRTITGRLHRHWIAEPEKEVLVFYDDDDQRMSMTGDQLKHMVEGCASLLRCNGVRKGDVVCNMLDVSPEREVINFAVIVSGAVLMDGLGIVDRDQRFWAPLIKANVKHLVVDPNDDSSIAWSMVAYNVENSYADIERATLKEMPELEKIFKFRMQHLMKSEEAQKDKSGFDLIKEHGSSFVEIVNSYDPAVIFARRTSAERIYKLIQRSHNAVNQLSQRAQEMLKLSRADIVFCDSPVSWLYGLSLTYITTGFTMVKTTLHNCPAQRVVRETWAVIDQEQCSVASLEPSMIIMLTSHCEDLPADHWTLRVITTSGLVNTAVMDSIGPVTRSVINCYTVVEAGLVSRLLVNAATKTRFTDGCVGELIDPARTRLDIKGTGAVQPSKIGEVVLRGQLVCKEYFNDPHLTASSYTSDGFLKTGDLGFYEYHDQSPYHDMLFVLGRKSQAIIRGDTAIFPRDIEEKVNQCPGIWKVSIVSIRDEKGVVQMCACVIPRSQDSVTIERVKEFCRYMLGGTADDDDNPHMPTYVFFFTDFPMLGKDVDKHTLAHTTAAVVSGTDQISNSYI